MIGRIAAITGVLLACGACALGGGRRSHASEPSRTNPRSQRRDEAPAAALTPAEWTGASEKPGLRAVQLAQGSLVLSNDEIGLEAQIISLTPRERQQAAAFCLQGQSFGFTWEDVHSLALAARQLRAGDRPGLAVSCESIGARVAALLPPKPALTT